MTSNNILYNVLLIGIASVFAVFVGLGIRRKNHLYYTIGAAGLSLAVFELVYPQAFSLTATIADIVLIPIAVWAAIQYDKGRLDKYSQGLLAIMIAVIILTGVSISLSPHDLFDVMLGAGILVGYLVLGIFYYLGRKRGLRFADLNLCSFVDRRILYASMAVGLLISITIGGIMFAPLAYLHKAKLGPNFVRDEIVDWGIVAISIYAMYWLMEWSIRRCLALKTNKTQ